MQRGEEGGSGVDGKLYDKREKGKEAGPCSVTLEVSR